MSTTTPTEFIGEPTLTPEKIELFKEWYESALADSDKAGEVEAVCFYDGGYIMAESILRTLFNMPLEEDSNETIDSQVPVPDQQT